MFTYPDAKALDETQRRELTKLAHAGFVEIRSLLWSGRTEQAIAAAEAFHNLPLFLYSDRFSFRAVREAMERYQQKFPSTGTIDFVAEVDRIAAGDTVTNVFVP